MRYYPCEKRSLQNLSTFHRMYATDVIAINDWLHHNFYSAYGDPIVLTFEEEAVFATILLNMYYEDAEWGGAETPDNHSAMLREWLEIRDSCCTDEGEPDCLLDILEGCNF